MILHLVGTLAAAATIAARPAAAGDGHEIVSDRGTTTHGPNGSSGNASDVDAVIERVLAVRPDGLELEYDLSRDASPGERSSQ